MKQILKIATTTCLTSKMKKRTKKMNYFILFQVSVTFQLPILPNLSYVGSGPCYVKNAIINIKHTSLVVYKIANMFDLLIT